MRARHSICGGLLMVGLTMNSLAFAQNTPAVGGSGGSSYSRQCRSNEILVGIYVAYGLWMDQVGAICASANNVLTGTWDDSRDIGSVGYPHLGTTKKRSTCPTGYGVKSFKVSSASYVDSIRLTCNKLGQSWRTTTETTQLSLLGGSGGTAQPSQSCSGAMHAVGIHGKGGEYVDSFGLLCGNVLPATPSLYAPVNGLTVTSKRPTFYWTNATRDLGKNTVCLNTTQTADCAASGTVRGEIDYTGSNWTPAQDLPYSRGTRVYWRVTACNDNGCSSGVSWFTAY